MHTTTATRGGFVLSGLAWRPICDRLPLIPEQLEIVMSKNHEPCFFKKHPPSVIDVLVHGVKAKLVVGEDIEPEALKHRLSVLKAEDPQHDAHLFLQCAPDLWVYRVFPVSALSF